MKDKKTIYFAAALFSARETIFNSLLAEKFEADGHQVLLPQRDGFEFANLQELLKKSWRKATDEEISIALQTIIYLLDIGEFVYHSDVVLANLDEPIDEGVVVEITYARMIGCGVIGYRTDVRSPYGNLTDPLKGMHFFPAFQCNEFIWKPISAKNPREREDGIKSLYAELEERMLYYSNPRELPYQMKEVHEKAGFLFEGLQGQLHTSEGLQGVVNRYLKNREFFNAILPKF